MSSTYTKLGFGVGAAYAVITIVCMIKMSENAVFFFDPGGLVFLIWVLSPIALTAWLQAKSRIWWFALLAIGPFGAFAMYDMAFRPGSSTAALGFIFVPLYQWAFLGLVGLAALLAGPAEKRGHSE